MLRATNCILLILILLLTAVFGLIVLLIVATEQPEGMFDRFYAKSYRTDDARVLSPKTEATTTKAMSTPSSTRFSEIIQTTKLHTNESLSEEDFDQMNSTVRKLRPLDLKLSNTEKMMSTGMKNKDIFFVAKANGEVDFFNWTTMQYIETGHLSVHVHRLDFLSDGGGLAVTDIQTKTLNLFDSQFKLTVQLKLGYQALDLRVFDDMIYVLSRLDGTIFVYDSNLALKFKIEWAKENACNFIQPGREFVFVSCDTAVLKVSNDGKILQRVSNVPGALYSLAIYVNKDELWAVQRGKEEIHVYDVYNQKFQLKYKLSTGSEEENAVWSAIGTGDDGRVFALDYSSNTIDFFAVET